MQLKLSEVSQKKIKAMDRGCTENKPIFGRVLKTQETLPFDLLVKVDNGVIFLCNMKFQFSLFNQNYP